VQSVKSAQPVNQDHAAYNQLDDGIIEPLVLLIPRCLDHLKQMVDEVIIELSQFLFIQLLNPTDFIHQVRSRQA
jgi:hypothetical protein